MTTDSANGEKLGGICEDVLDAIDKTLSWTEADAMPAAERHTLQLNLRQSRREFRRLKRAATRPMCVAVFGPSQVGKSYLINSLSRREGRSIAVRFGDQDFDFLSELNPQGGGTEATGLVSRFSTRPLTTPEGFPVQVRLHSHSDIIKIIANTYFSDFNVAVEAAFLIGEDDIRAQIETARKKCGAPGSGSLNEDDVLDIKEYIEERFHGRRTEEILRTTGFWDDFAAMAGQLDTDQAELLVELIWGRNARLTELYRLVRSALERVEFAETAYCEIGALKPRERSIINIDSLDNLGKSGDDTVQVKIPSGKVAGLGRAEMTAIVSELVLTLAESPAAYFDHADLLDFPGYRPRFELSPEKMHEYLDRTDAFRELFRRGKVDYLFDSYRREQEVTALLLCLGKGNQDVHAIPPLVDRWVKETHGATPDLRGGKDVALFVVKTMFDKYFEDSEGSDASSGEVWNKAIGQECFEFFGRSGDWPKNWTKGQPFQNLFWIRNPAFKSRNLIEYSKEDKSKEVGLVNPELVDEVEKSYLAEDLVQRHIENPSQAFKAALKLDDGGIEYLTGKLAPICNPTIKASQVKTRMTASAERLLGRLREHYVSDNKDAERQKREDAAEKAINLAISYAELERFYHLIDILQIDRDVLRRAIAQADRSGKKKGAPVTPRAAAGSRKSISALMGRPAEAASGDVPEDRSQFGAKAAIEEWSREALVQAEQALPITGLEPEPEVLRTLVQEILQAAARLKLENDIAGRLREFTSDTFADDEFRDIQSSVSSEEINEFVWTLGYGKVPPEERPRLGGGQGDPIFLERHASPNDLTFDLDAQSHVDVTVASWCTAYVDMVARNIAGPRPDLTDPERNRQLGEIIVGVDNAVNGA